MRLNKQNAKEEYCMISAIKKKRWFRCRPKIMIHIDFGQKLSFWRSTKYTHRLRDEKGRIITFNSIIDALNYMSSLGWEFVNAYVMATKKEKAYHYIMKRVLTEADKNSNE